jgi:hypothetical protein
MSVPTFLERTTAGKDNGKPADMVNQDFSKASDKVPHEKLFRKMEERKTSRDVVKRVEELLPGRMQ